MSARARPTVIALIGLLGILVGEQIAQLAKRLISSPPMTISWLRRQGLNSDGQSMSYLTFYDVRLIMEDVFSEHFHVHHKDYYTPYIRNFERRPARRSRRAASRGARGHISVSRPRRTSARRTS